jgi:hypothetical protein
MKHVVKPSCRHGCRFLQIADGLWLCPHAAYGESSYMLGAIEEARRVLERAGGYDAVLAKIQNAEFEKKEARRLEREARQNRAAASVRYR